MQAELRAELTLPGYKELSSRQRRKGRKEMFRQQNVTEQFQKAFHNSVSAHAWPVGILCLSEANDSNLMWYHYAELAAPRRLCPRLRSAYAEASARQAGWKKIYAPSSAATFRARFLTGKG